MQITKFSDYALRVLIHLCASGEKQCSTREISDQQGISFFHLAKVTGWLATEGYVNSTRGRSGGLILARPASEIRIGEIVRKSEAGTALVECMRADGGACALTPCCSLAPLLSDASEAFFQVLDQKTLADICGSQPRLKQLIASLAVAGGA